MILMKFRTHVFWSHSKNHTGTNLGTAHDTFSELNFEHFNWHTEFRTSSSDFTQSRLVFFSKAQNVLEKNTRIEHAKSELDIRLTILMGITIIIILSTSTKTFCIRFVICVVDDVKLNFKRGFKKYVRESRSTRNIQRLSPANSSEPAKGSCKSPSTFCAWSSSSRW